MTQLTWAWEGFCKVNSTEVWMNLIVSDFNLGVGRFLQGVS